MYLLSGAAEFGTIYWYSNTSHKEIFFKNAASRGLESYFRFFAIKCQISAIEDRKAIRRPAFPRAKTAKTRDFVKDAWNRKWGGS